MVSDKKHLEKWLNRLKGQVAGIEKMVAEERDCIETITQIQAARASLAALAQKLLEDEAACCLDSPPKHSQARFKELVTGIFRIF